MGKAIISKWRQAVVTVLILDKIDYKPKVVRNDKEGCITLIREKVQETITILNMHIKHRYIQFHKTNSTGCEITN